MYYACRKGNCKCNPHNIQRLAKRFKETNTWACEQGFALRNYASILNDIEVFGRAKPHNEAIHRKKATHFNKYSKPARPTRAPRSDSSCVAIGKLVLTP